MVSFIYDGWLYISRTQTILLTRLSRITAKTACRSYTVFFRNAGYAGQTGSYMEVFCHGLIQQFSGVMRDRQDHIWILRNNRSVNGGF